MKTQITEMLGIRYPIVQGGMQWVGTAELIDRIVKQCRERLATAAAMAAS